MTFDFANLRQEVLENCTLSPDFFGEQVTISIEGEREISLSAKVQVARDRRTDQHTHDEIEVAEVTIGKDPTNTVIGGIARPRTGMRLLRHSSRDAGRGPFVFTGKITGDTAQFWRLEFERRTRKSQGRRVA